MHLIKRVRDSVVKFILGGHTAPQGLVELHYYFRTHEPIRFRNERQEDGSCIAISENFQYGKIITRADCVESLDDQVKDAILTAFDVPFSYAKEAGVHRVGETEYAFA